MTYSFVSYSDTQIKVTEDTREYIYKKVYCTTSVDGDYFIFSTHNAETGLMMQQYKLLYSDCTSPSTASASALKTAVDAIVNSYAGGGGGGTITTGTFVMNFATGESYVSTTVAETVVNATDDTITFTPSDRIEDYALEQIAITIQSVIASTGFTVLAHAPNNTSGSYTIKYTIIN